MSTKTVSVAPAVQAIRAPAMKAVPSDGLQKLAERTWAVAQKEIEEGLRATLGHPRINADSLKQNSLFDLMAREISFMDSLRRDVDALHKLD